MSTGCSSCQLSHLPFFPPCLFKTPLLHFCFTLISWALSQLRYFFPWDRGNPFFYVSAVCMHLSCYEKQPPYWVICIITATFFPLSQQTLDITLKRHFLQKKSLPLLLSFPCLWGSRLLSTTVTGSARSHYRVYFHKQVLTLKHTWKRRRKTG